MTELMPCPFCASLPERLVELWDSFDAGTIAHIHCEKCGADGPSIYSEVNANESLRRARKAWNSRVDENALKSADS